MWKEKKLDNVCLNITDGKHGDCKNEENSGYYFISSKDVNSGKIHYNYARQITRDDFLDCHRRTKLEANDILITNSGTIGRMALVNNNPRTSRTTFQKSVAIIKANSEVVKPKYLYYRISNDLWKFVNTSGGTAQQNLLLKDLRKIKIAVPTLIIQQKIADILSAYDDLIENNNRRIELLEQATQQIFKEWFLRFRFPGYENAQFSKGIPNGWEAVKIGEEINIKSSKRIFLSDYVENGVPFYRSREIIQMAKGQTTTDPLFIGKEKYNQIKARFGVPEINDILLTSVGTIGISLLVKNDNPFYFKDGNLTWLQSSKKPLFGMYLYFWLNSDLGKQQILASTIGTSQSALTIENLRSVKVLKPDKAVLNNFSNVITPINAMLENLGIKNQNLTKQRDLLLPRIMSGKIKV